MSDSSRIPTFEPATSHPPPLQGFQTAVDAPNSVATGEAWSLPSMEHSYSLNVQTPGAGGAGMSPQAAFHARGGGVGLSHIPAAQQPPAMIHSQHPAAPLSSSPSHGSVDAMMLPSFATVSSVSRGQATAAALGANTCSLDAGNLPPSRGAGMGYLSHVTPATPFSCTSGHAAQHAAAAGGNGADDNDDIDSITSCHLGGPLRTPTSHPRSNTDVSTSTADARASSGGSGSGSALLLTDEGNVPKDPCNLIVNYIPTPVTDAELRQMFEQFGEVTSARVILDRVTQQPKGYGFVKFSREEDSRRALQEMNGFSILNKRLKITPARGPQADGLLASVDGPAASGDRRSGAKPTGARTDSPLNLPSTRPPTPIVPAPPPLGLLNRVSPTTTTTAGSGGSGAPSPSQRGGGQQPPPYAPPRRLSDGPSGWELPGTPQHAVAPTPTQLQLSQPMVLSAGGTYGGGGGLSATLQPTMSPAVSNGALSAAMLPTSHHHSSSNGQGQSGGATGGGVTHGAGPSALPPGLHIVSVDSMGRQTLLTQGDARGAPPFTQGGWASAASGMVSSSQQQPQIFQMPLQPNFQTTRSGGGGGHLLFPPQMHMPTGQAGPSQPQLQQQQQANMAAAFAQAGFTVSFANPPMLGGQPTGNASSVGQHLGAASPGWPPFQS